MYQMSTDGNSGIHLGREEKKRDREMMINPTKKVMTRLLVSARETVTQTQPYYQGKRLGQSRFQLI